MKNNYLKLLTAVLCLVMICSSLSSCGVFFDEENNFVGFDKIITRIYGE